MYLPTGVINPIPMSKQVLTNPVPTPLNPISFFSGKIKSSFGRLFKKKKDKTNKIPTSAADSMGGRISQRGKDNKVIRSDAAAFIPKNKNIINTDRRNRRAIGGYNSYGERANDGYRRGVEHIEANTRNIDEAHAQSCKEYGITFSEEMERSGPFYTEKAMEDWERQLSF